MKSTRVIIDASCLGRRKTGNETYIHGLLSGFQALAAPDLDLTVLTTRHFSGNRLPPFRWLEIPEGNFLTRNFATIPKLLSRSKADLFHATYWAKFWNPFPFVVTIHDISFHTFPQGFKKHERLVYCTLVKKAAENARHIITVSEFSKKELCEHWKIAPEKVTVVYNGLPPSFQIRAQPRSAINEKEPPPEDYILYVGNLHPRKNLVRLLQAFVILKKEKKIKTKLKIVGQKAWLYGDIFSTARQYQLENEVEFTGYVNQEELIHLYQNAAATAYPSLYEGFGLPVIEAMACGSPVVASNTTSIPEVAGEAAILVNPESSEEIAAGLWEALSSPDRRSELRQQGLQQSKKFQWQQAAAQTLAIYRQSASG